MFEGLEIDQYVWSVLQNKQTVEFDEVTVDQNAKIKPCLPTIIKVNGINFHWRSNNGLNVKIDLHRFLSTNRIITIEFLL